MIYTCLHLFLLFCFFIVFISFPSRASLHVQNLCTTAGELYVCYPIHSLKKTLKYCFNVKVTECGGNVTDVYSSIVIQMSVYVSVCACVSGHVCVWPSGHCLLSKSGPSSRPACEQQLISSNQSCPHLQPPPSPERKINCTHAVNKNKKKKCIATKSHTAIINTT